MKHVYLLFLVLLLSVNFCIAQIELSLAQDKGNTQSIDLDIKYLKITSCLKNRFYYIVDVDKKTISTPVFNLQGAQSNKDFDPNTCPDIKGISSLIQGADSEKKLKQLIDSAKGIIKKTSDSKDCITYLQQLIDNSEIIFPLTFKIQNNQTITATITKYSTEDKTKILGTWTFILKTEEKSRWLVHYGLTYAPSLISKVDHFHSLADTSTANRYTITKDNSNGPKPWDNISATINFTYPFHGDSRGFDGGFTAGFGINTGLGLSGHAGLSAIIGDNVIISSGVALMQKYKLKGDYKEGQIIKENLSSDALHEKVWLPEIFFTIGFRFGSNPFASKTTSSTGTASTNTTQ